MIRLEVMSQHVPKKTKKNKKRTFSVVLNIFFSKIFQAQISIIR